MGFSECRWFRIRVALFIAMNRERELWRLGALAAAATFASHTSTRPVLLPGFFPHVGDYHVIRWTLCIGVGTMPPRTRPEVNGKGDHTGHDPRQQEQGVTDKPRARITTPGTA